MTAESLNAIGFWRYRKGVAHLMMPLGDDHLQSRCGVYIIQKLHRTMPLVLPVGWVACKRCMGKK